MDTTTGMNGRIQGNHYGFNTAMFVPFQQEPQESPTSVPTASMVESYSQPQHVASQQQVGTPETGPPQAPLSNPSDALMSRTLPTQDLTQESIDDAYVQFIFYCNPSIPLSTDTTELKKGFRLMPKTDGNSFDIFVLFQLIKKLEAKEIETWSQLVAELGVEPPDPTKNQSTQKVQQFAVRLKRWLHAFHIDAFFQHCLGKVTSYSTDLPPVEEGITDKMREGVPTEEDLALRALLPEWRPKRGRRKLDTSIGYPGWPSTPPKKVRREDSFSSKDVAMPQNVYSAHPQSALAWSQPPRQDDPWAAAQRALLPKSALGTAQPQSLSEQPNFWTDVPNVTPSTPYPHSAVTLRYPQSAFPSQDTPQSAHPFNSNGVRKRHGPAVSAAWPSVASYSPGKLPRGRPPSNRFVQNGPFCTFPANPHMKKPVKKTAGTPVNTAPPELTTSVSAAAKPLAIDTPVSATATQTPTKRPGKLSLQVPLMAGGPVRLATPPPKVLVNGEDGTSAPANVHTHERPRSAGFSISIDDGANETADDSDEEGDRVDWKRRALLLKRRLTEKEAELKAIRRRVMEAVM